ncbi:MAG: hypothetical protein ABSG42_01515, partial [Nitrospirota bacterium]
MLGIFLVCGCSSNSLVIGRAEEKTATPPKTGVTPKEAGKDESKVSQPRSEAAKAQPANADAKLVLVAEKTADVSSGAPPAEPQSSPAKPRPEPEPEQPQEKIPSPYKLDLSFGGFGLGVGLFDTPVSVAVDDQENIYVVDQGNYRI